MIFDLLNDLNQDCSFVEKINESSYVENVESITTNTTSTTTTTTTTSTPAKFYHNLVTCIISEFDPMFQTLNESEQKTYLSQKIMEICSKIDESDNFYHDYGFNEKIMKSHLIQMGLQIR